MFITNTNNTNKTSSKLQTNETRNAIFCQRNATTTNAAQIKIRSTPTHPNHTSHTSTTHHTHKIDLVTASHLVRFTLRQCAAFACFVSSLTRTQTAKHTHAKTLFFSSNDSSSQLETIPMVYRRLPAVRFH